jgi:hypothetical protein
MASELAAAALISLPTVLTLLVRRLSGVSPHVVRRFPRRMPRIAVIDSGLEPEAELPFAALQSPLVSDASPRTFLRIRLPTWLNQTPCGSLPR